jgi:tRNA threonylcarbamoyladenosine biosynthesis protein TsaB
MILVIEYSTPVASLALGDGTRNFSRSWSREKRGGEQLTPNIEALLEDAGLQVSAISKIVVSGGPGSFTGIRLAVSAARALAYVLSVPVALVDSLSAVAYSCEPSLKEVTVLTNAFGNSVYYGRFANVNGLWNLCEGPQHIPLSEASRYLANSTFVAGDAAEELKLTANPDFGHKLKQDSRAVSYPNATKVLQAILDQGLALEWKSWESLTPLYIKRSGAEEKHRS